jgi:transmembrane sensor
MAESLTSSDQVRIDDEASDWILRLSERALDGEEKRELQAWRSADPRHERTFVAMQRTWDDMPGLTHLAGLVSVDAAPAEASRPGAQARRPRYALAGLAAAAAALLAVILLPPLWAPAPQYSTELAQSRLIALPDGSQVTLGPKSSLDVDFSASERRVRLTGEAFFEVAHNAARPFLVEAGSALVRVVGTKFDVNQASETVRVSVLEGVVQVIPPKLGPAASRPDSQLLRAGQHLEVALDPAVPVRRAASPATVASPAAPPGAWREGRLSYDNARLGDVVADLNRYYAPGVTLRGPGLGNLRVTASFKASQIPAFIASLDKVVPVQTDRSPGGAILVKARGS